MGTTLFTGCCKYVIFSALISSLLLVRIVMSVEFEVGGDKGWVIPNSKNDQIYDQWASNNRFKVDDTVRFEYKKDSVLVVSTEEEYSNCKSSHPIFFSNNGNTLFKFDRPGLFYFISGVAGHCERGQKMIIKVLEPESLPPPPPPPPPSNGAAVEMAEIMSSPILVPMIIMSLVWAIFM